MESSRFKIKKEGREWRVRAGNSECGEQEPAKEKGLVHCSEMGYIFWRLCTDSSTSGDGFQGRIDL
jgi:hypothetical protein